MSNPEINDMHLVWEDELIMMICSNSREYMVFDERNPEESKLLRRVVGGHQEEITIMEYSYHLSLVATGCINGEITLYDFEMSKIEGILLGHTGDITALGFMEPYPALVSASMDATVCIWGVRPCPYALQNVCLKRMINMSWNFDKDAPCVVSRFLIWHDRMKGIKKYRRLQKKQIPAQNFRNFEQNFVFSLKDMEAIFDEEYAELKVNQFTALSEEFKLQQVLNSAQYKKILEDKISLTFMTQVE